MKRDEKLGARRDLKLNRRRSKQQNRLACRATPVSLSTYHGIYFIHHTFVNIAKINEKHQIQLQTSRSWPCQNEVLVQREKTDSLAYFRDMYNYQLLF